MSNMKPSGFEWIGDMPEHWNLMRVKDLFKITAGNGFSIELQGRTNEQYPFLKCSDLASMEKQTSEVNNSVSQADVTKEGYNLIEPGSILMAKIGEAMKKNRRVLSRVTCCIDNNMQALTPEQSLYISRYALLVLMQINSEDYDNGGPIPSINNIKLKSALLPLPPLLEQQKIVDYLDEKCVKMDKILEVLSRQIEVLEQYKKSIIHEAVTKGLAPNVPMKPSGVEWIGGIPEHWEITKLKYLATGKVALFQDGDWIESDVIEESGIRYLTSGNVGAGYYKNQGHGYIATESFKKLGCLAVYPGDLMISRLNSPIGRACIVPEDYPIYVVAVDNVILRGDYFDTKYMMYAMNSLRYSEHLELIARGSTMQRISRTILGNVHIWFPPLQEQQEIADYLDEKCAKVDAILDIKRKQIEVLKKRRQSLIYEYVTGKRRVEVGV